MKTIYDEHGINTIKNGELDGLDVLDKQIKELMHNLGVLGYNLSEVAESLHISVTAAVCLEKMSNKYRGK